MSKSAGTLVMLSIVRIRCLVWEVSTFSIKYVHVYEQALLLKLPSLFAVYIFFLTFHNKSHDMKSLVILRLFDHHFSHLLVYIETNELLWVSVWPSEVYLREKSTVRLLIQITWPWPPVGRISHGLITVTYRKMWT